MTVNITLDDIKSVASSKGLELTDLQAQEVLDYYTERQWQKAKWLIEDILTEINNNSPEGNLGQ